MKAALPRAGLRVQIGLVAVIGVVALLIVLAGTFVSSTMLADATVKAEAAHAGLAGLNAVWHGMLDVRRTEADFLSGGDEQAALLHETAITGLRDAIVTFGAGNAQGSAALLRDHLDVYEKEFSRVAARMNDAAAALAAEHAIETSLGQLDSATEAALLEPLHRMRFADDAHLGPRAAMFSEGLTAAAIPDGTRTAIAAQLAIWRHGAPAASQLENDQARLRDEAQGMEGAAETVNRMAAAAARRADDTIQVMRDRADRLTHGAFALALLVIVLGGLTATRTIVRPLEDIATYLRGLVAGDLADGVPSLGRAGEAGQMAAALVTLRDGRLEADRRVTAAEAHLNGVADLARRLMAEIAAETGLPDLDSASLSMEAIAEEVKALTELTMRATEEIGHRIASIEAVPGQGQAAA